MAKPEDGRVQAHRIFIRESVAAILQKSIRDQLPPGTEVSPDELEAFTQLGLMCVATTGDEDPRSMLSRISDPLLEHMASKLDEAGANQAVKNVCQLALIEWCARKGHLNGDWVWKWDDRTRGRASFSAKMSMEEAYKLLKSNRTPVSFGMDDPGPSK